MPDAKAWGLIGAGAGGFVAGLVSYHFLRDEQVYTGLSQAYQKGDLQATVKIFHTRLGGYRAVVSYDYLDDIESDGLENLPPKILLDHLEYPPEDVFDLADEMMQDDGWALLGSYRPDFQQEEAQPPPAPPTVRVTVLGHDGLPMIDHPIHLWSPETGHAQTARTNHSGNAVIEIDPAAGPGQFILAPSLINEQFEEVWKAKPDKVNVDTSQPMPGKFVFTLTRRAPKRKGAAVGRRH